MLFFYSSLLCFTNLWIHLSTMMIKMSCSITWEIFLLKRLGKCIFYQNTEYRIHQSGVSILCEKSAFSSFQSSKQPTNHIFLHRQFLWRHDFVQCKGVGVDESPNRYIYSVWNPYKIFSVYILLYFINCLFFL